MATPTDTAAHVLFTLGYQERTIDELVQELVDAGAGVLVDVRENPWSRRPAFRRSALERELGAAGIEYAHARFAGNPKRFRKAASSYAECLRMYTEHLDDQPGILDRLSALLSPLLDADKRVCLFCYERHPGDCHRSILLERWTEHAGLALDVVHLAPDGARRFIKD